MSAMYELANILAHKKNQHFFVKMFAKIVDNVFIDCEDTRDTFRESVLACFDQKKPRNTASLRRCVRFFDTNIKKLAFLFLLNFLCETRSRIRCHSRRL